MGKDGGFLTPKAIGNRIKAKGLQKLRWYCQMCQKQCRDEVCNVLYQNVCRMYCIVCILCTMFVCIMYVLCQYVQCKVFYFIFTPSQAVSRPVDWNG